MTKLYLAWQDCKSRGWFPVGRLTTGQDSESDAVEYEYAYIKGALTAKKEANFLPIPGFPDLGKRYCSKRLFPMFQNRVMNPRRPDRPEYLRRLGLDENTDAVAELAASGGYRHTDSYQVFPAIVPDDANGRFNYRCMLHGLRHRSPDAIRRTESLVIGEALTLSPTPDAPTATLAIMVQTHDCHHIGWVPRYFVDDLQQDGAWIVADAQATVAQVNLDAPLSRRLLVDFSGRLPSGFRMEDLPQYQPIAPLVAYPTNRSSGKNAETV